MFVPKENILGEYGRIEAGAHRSRLRPHHVRSKLHRRGEILPAGGDQICERAQAVRKSLGEFELVREKIALAAAEMYAMESATYHTAALIDTGPRTTCSKRR